VFERHGTTLSLTEDTIHDVVRKKGFYMQKYMPKNLRKSAIEGYSYPFSITLKKNASLQAIIVVKGLATTF